MLARIQNYLLFFNCNSFDEILYDKVVEPQKLKPINLNCKNENVGRFLLNAVSSWASTGPLAKERLK